MVVWPVWVLVARRKLDRRLAPDQHRPPPDRSRPRRRPTRTHPAPNTPRTSCLGVALATVGPDGTNRKTFWNRGSNLHETFSSSEPPLWSPDSSKVLQRPAKLAALC